MIKELCTLAIGGMIGGLGTWFAAALQERYRRQVRADEALLKWLNTQDAALRELVCLAEEVTKSTVTLEFEEQFVNQLTVIEAKISTLASAMHEHMVFSTTGWADAISAPSIVELSTKTVDLLVQRLKILISHHALHLRFRAKINVCNDLIASQSVPLDDETAEILEKRLTIKLKAIESRDSAEEHLSTCTATLESDAIDLLEQCRTILKQNDHSRRLVIARSKFKI